mgnify:CR=1 FL=1
MLRHAFGQEGLTRRFFEGVVALHQRLGDAMIDGPADAAARAQIGHPAARQGVDMIGEEIGLCDSQRQLAPPWCLRLTALVLTHD